MLTTFDFSIAIAFAICYNLLAHCIVSALFDSKDYLAKYNYSIATLMVLAVMAAVMSKLLCNRFDTPYTDSVICVGLGIASLLLILTIILIDWQNFNEFTQVIIIGIIIAAICYYVYYFC